MHYLFAEELAAEILSRMPDGALIRDGEGTIIYCNSAMEDLCGLKREALLGRQVIPALTVSDEGSFQQGSMAGLTEGYFPVRGKKKRWVQITTYSVNRDSTYQVEIFRDITDHRLETQRLALLSDMMRRLNSARTASEMASILLGTLDEMIGWDSAFVDLLASDTERRISPSHLLIPALHVDLVDGVKQPVPPIAYVLPIESNSKRCLTEGPLLVLRTAEEQNGPNPHAFGNADRRSGSLLYIPIQSDAGNFGVVSIQSYALNAFSEEDVKLAQVFIEASTTAIERVRTQDRIRLLESAVLHSSDMILITGTDPSSETGSSIIFVNHAFEKFTGYSSEELYGKSIRLLQGPRTDAAAYESIKLALLQDRPIRTELVNYRKDGSPYMVELSIFPILNTDSPYRYYVSVHRDITERKKQEERLAFSASHDPLTNLANRSLLMERLRSAMGRSLASNETIAVLFADLDGFKAINDRFGHDAGDQVLVEVSRRIESCVRPSDTVARFGGDEFIVLLDQMQTGRTAVAVAQRVVDCLREPIRVFDHVVFCHGSVGIAIADASEMSADEALRRADAALYRAKALGKNRFELYQEV